MKVHWVNGVEEEKKKQENQTTAIQEKPRHNNKNPLNQTNHQNQSTTHEGGEEDRGLNRRFKRGVKDKGIGHWVNGVESKPIISDRPVLQVINTSQRLNRPMIST